MTAVWLYEEDGRRYAYVYVPTPMPKMVTYAGGFFEWSAAMSGYVRVVMPVPCVGDSASENIPEVVNVPAGE